MDRPPRLKTEIRVAAQLRRVAAAGAFAHVARRGDPDAGALAVKVYLGRIDGAPRARLFMQSLDGEGATVWRDLFDGATDEPVIDARLERERRVDPDLWIVEIEDAEGRAFLD